MDNKDMKTLSPTAALALYEQQVLAYNLGQTCDLHDGDTTNFDKMAVLRAALIARIT